MKSDLVLLVWRVQKKYIMLYATESAVTLNNEKHWNLVVGNSSTAMLMLSITAQSQEIFRFFFFNKRFTDATLRKVILNTGPQDMPVV